MVNKNGKVALECTHNHRGSRAESLMALAATATHRTSHHPLPSLSADFFAQPPSPSTTTTISTSTSTSIGARGRGSARSGARLGLQKRGVVLNISTALQQDQQLQHFVRQQGISPVVVHVNYCDDKEKSLQDIGLWLPLAPPAQPPTSPSFHTKAAARAAAAAAPAGLQNV